jgi:hypothetical protein
MAESHREKADELHQAAEKEEDRAGRHEERAEEVRPD